jgi:hypothetical protein
VNETYWLTATNIALAAIVVICAIFVASAVVREAAERMYKRAKISAELDRDMRRLVQEFDDHAFLNPHLGITMADGGGKIEPPKDSQ